MNNNRLSLAIPAVLLVLLTPFELRADSSLGDKDYPKHYHWRGEVGGEPVVLDIDAAYFVAAKHTVKDDGDVIDGYPALPTYSTGNGSKFPYFTIAKWNILWGHKRLQPFPRGVYTSVFTPDLQAKDHPDPNNVEVVGCDGGDALMVSMGFGYDAITGTVRFVITKDGRMRRFITGMDLSNW